MATFELPQSLGIPFAKHLLLHPPESAIQCVDDDDRLEIFWVSKGERVSIGPEIVGHLED